jgi:diguanylate cyclase (GGDEF)-like protein/PAS domain S-box-containing protein
VPRPQYEQLLVAILQSSEDAIIGIALDGSIEMWSSGAERLYGYTASEVTGNSIMTLLPIYEVAAFQAVLGAARTGAMPGSESVERLHKFGAKITVAVRHTVMRDELGRATSILESGRAVCKLIEDKTPETQLRLLVEQMPVQLWTTDLQLRIASIWGLSFQYGELPAQNPVGRTIAEYLECPAKNTSLMANHYAALRGESIEFEYKRLDRTLEIKLEPLRTLSGLIIGCIGVGLDITRRKRTEEQIRHQASHDALTGLANYRELMETLERELRRAGRSGHSFSVLLLDVDNLKRINDRMGHLAGNRALKRLGNVLKQQCRATDVGARYGGDEFAVVLIESDEKMALQVAERIEAATKDDPEGPAISVSIGIAVYPVDGCTAQELLESADQRLYRRKQRAATPQGTAG